MHLQTRSITASTCISEFTPCRPPSASPNSLDHGLPMHLPTRSSTASKYIVKVRQWMNGDTGVTELECATRSIYSWDPGVDRQHLIFISSCHITKILTLSFPTFGLTPSSRDFVDPSNCVDPQGQVVSYLVTFFPRSSGVMEKQCEERFLQRHPLHCIPDASVYPMNPFRRMVTVGHNARVFVQNWRPTEREETAKRRSEGDMQCDAWY